MMRSVKKWLSSLLCLALLLTVLPTAAWATDSCTENLECSANTHTDDCPRNTTDLTRAKLAEMLYQDGNGPFGSVIGSNTNSAGFNDIGEDEEGSESAYDVDAINALANAGILSGTAEGTFNPTGTVTRAELAVVFWRVTGSKSTNAPGTDFDLSDVAPNAWYAPAVVALYATGLVTGTSDKKFNPDDEAAVGMVNALLLRYDEQQSTISILPAGVTRAEMAVAAYNKYKDSPYAQAKIAEVENSFTSKLRDIDDCSGPEKEAILFFEKLGIAKGYNEPEGEGENVTYPFYPDVPASNLQIAAFLMQCAQLDTPAPSEGTSGETTDQGGGTETALSMAAVFMADPPTMDETTTTVLDQIKAEFGEDSTIAKMAASNPNAPAAASAPTTMASSIQVEAPTITFADGKATITAADEGATIYYTNNGDTPTTSSTKYENAIDVTQGTTVKAIAVQYSLSSAVASATYEMTITPSSTSLTGGGTVTFSIANAPADATNVSVTCDVEGITPSQGTDSTWSVTLPNADATYTFTATAGSETATCQVSVTYKSTSSGNSGGTSGNSSNTTTTTERNPDGSTTTTTTNRTTGTVTETTRYPDGSREVVETKRDGTVTTTTTDTDGNETAVVENPDGTREVRVEQADGTSASAVADQAGRIQAEVSLSSRAVSAAQKDGEAVTLPIPNIPISGSSEDASLVEIDLPRSAGAVKVEIPTEDAGPGTVAVIVNEDGTETVVKKSVALDGGLTLTLETGATVKIVDNRKDFDDTYDHWAEDAIAFATAHEMFGGTSADTFSPDTPMTRGMLAVVLHRFEDTPNHTFTGSFEDVAPGSWYADGIHWMADNGIIGGYGDGNFGANDSITREQLATILYRYADVMGYGTSGGASLNRFSDVDNVSGYAVEAMGWAVENGLIGGMGDGTLAPQGSATRAQVATILMRFVENLVN